MDDEAETYKLWSVRKTLMEMCKDRGYSVPEGDLLLTLEQFKERFGDRPSSSRPQREDLDTILSKSDDDEHKMYIFFPNEVKIGVNVVRDILDKMRSQGTRSAVLVLRKKLSFYAKKSLAEIKPINVETFMESELYINITQHELVPKHIVMSAKEKKELLAKYKMKESQLMKMQTSDPVARYFGLTPGTAVKIIRPSETTEEYTSYRVVV